MSSWHTAAKPVCGSAFETPGAVPPELAGGEGEAALAAEVVRVPGFVDPVPVCPENRLVGLVDQAVVVDVEAVDRLAQSDSAGDAGTTL
jgi:hypothetical protein